MGKIFPSKAQWVKWTLPSKATFFGACLGIIAILMGLSFGIYSIFKNNYTHLTVVASDPSKTEIINCEQDSNKHCPLELEAFMFKYPHVVDSKDAGIIWKEDYSDVRVLLKNNTMNAIQDISLVLAPETHIRKITQLTQIPDVTLVPDRGPVQGMALIGKDEKGNETSIPVNIGAPGEHITPSYRLLCPKLLPQAEIEIVIACIALNPWENGKPPLQAIAKGRNPKSIGIYGTYEVRNGLPIRKYNVKSQISLIQDKTLK